MSLKEVTELTSKEKEIILDQSRAVFNFTDSNHQQCVEKIKLVIDSPNGKEKSIISADKFLQGKEHQFPKGIWGKVVKKFIQQFGIELYTHWLTKLTTEENQESGIIRLKIENDLVRDRIVSEYISSLEAVARGYGFTISV